MDDLWLNVTDVHFGRYPNGLALFASADYTAGNSQVKLRTLLHALDAYERLYSVIRQQSALNALTSGYAGSYYQCMRME